MGGAKQAVDPFHAEADMEGGVVVLVVMRHMFAGDALAKPAFLNVQMRQRVAVFIECESRD